MLQRLLPERPQKGVVDDDRRPACGVGVEGVPRFRNGGDVDKLVGGVGRAFQIDAADTTERLRPPERGVDLLSGSACRKRSEEHTSELQSLMRISYAVFCLKKKTTKKPSIKQTNYTTLTV